MFNAENPGNNETGNNEIPNASEKDKNGKWNIANIMSAYEEELIS